jgi:hypothetical protein
MLIYTITSVVLANQSRISIHKEHDRRKDVAWPVWKLAASHSDREWFGVSLGAQTYAGKTALQQ